MSNDYLNLARDLKLDYMRVYRMVSHCFQEFVSDSERVDFGSAFARHGVLCSANRLANSPLNVAYAVRIRSRGYGMPAR